MSNILEEFSEFVETKVASATDEGFLNGMNEIYLLSQRSKAPTIEDLKAEIEMACRDFEKKIVEKYDFKRI